VLQVLRLGVKVLLLLLVLVFWITISGANIPSGWLSELLIERVYPGLRASAVALGWPDWLRGVSVDGMFLATAWVISVMLPLALGLLLTFLVAWVLRGS